MQQGEFEFIQNLKERFLPRKRKIVGIGDDCAVIEGDLMVTTDALVEGVHFNRSWISSKDLGYKAMMVNISDLAAMGGYPEYALITLGMPSSIRDAEVEAWTQGIEDARDEFGLEIIGGDTVKSEKVFFSVTMMGRPFVKPVLRSSAQVKDTIYVSGTLGDSRIGLELLKGEQNLSPVDKDYFLSRHNRPLPRVLLMEYLAHHVHLNACLDISDGLLGDLLHIADESGLGFFIESSELPVSTDAFGENSELLLRYALNGGEDYELLFTSPDVLDCVKIEHKTGVRITPIGTILPEHREVSIGGVRKPAAEVLQSYRHF